MNQYEVAVNETGLEPTQAKALLAQFEEFFHVADEWEQKAKSIVVTDESQTEEMKMARIGRLKLKQMRIDIEKKRKALKESIVREGKAIDGLANVLKAVIIPLEKHLDEQERFVEIRDAKIEAERAEKARKLLEEQEAKEKAEAERLEKERQEKIRLENERLREEAKAREAELAEARRIEKERAEAQAKEKAEMQAKLDAEEKARAEAEKAVKAAEESNKTLKAAVKTLAIGEVKCPNCNHIFKP